VGTRLGHHEFNTVLVQLGRDYDIYAPKRFADRGRFSDTDLIRYDTIARIEEIEWEAKSQFSPKDIVIPVTQTLFHFTEDEYREPAISDRPMLVFLRPCDINGLHRLDAIYLHNGKDEDFYYKRLREKIKFVMIECTTGFENCFCVSMDANTTDDFSMAVRFADDHVMLDVRDESFSGYVRGIGKPVEFTPEFIQKNQQVVTPPDVENMPAEIHDHPMWDEYKTRCIACGRCTTTCVTCSCHTTTDIFYDDNPKMGERRRAWSSCHVDGFTDIAGGHSFRTDNAARMRFKTLHKVYDYKKRFGEHMCVGCGRCDDNCPEYISYANAVNKLSEIV
jgi:anaerobic sulfite reductase subunit A